MHPAVAHWILGELMSAAAALHRYPGVAHGAISPERIVITSDRRIVIADYIFGDALNALRLPSERLWDELRVVQDSRHDGAALDQHSDVVQIALIALSLVIGHRVTADEYAHERRLLVDAFSAACERQMTAFGSGLRTWLDHALSPGGFRSAVEAHRALVDLTGTPAIGEWSARTRETADLEGGLVPTPTIAKSDAAALTIAAGTSDASGESDADPRSRRFGPFHWMAAALAIIGVIQGAVIARLVFRSPAAPAAAVALPVADRSVSVVDQPAQRDEIVRDLTDRTPAPAPASPAVPIATMPGAVIASSRGTAGTARLDGVPRNGTLRVDSPIDVDISSGSRRLGSSRGSIALSAGTHELTFTNAALGVQLTQTVHIEPGRQTSLSVEAPRGTLNANAQPWAQVSIDGQPIGETPLANIAVDAGEHIVLFRHPQLGERRQQVTVRAGTLTRVSATFTR
jgi:hypothetical protein